MGPRGYTKYVVTVVSDNVMMQSKDDAITEIPYERAVMSYTAVSRRVRSVIRDFAFSLTVAFMYQDRRGESSGCFFRHHCQEDRTHEFT
jgi:hypothetical protein